MDVAGRLNARENAQTAASETRVRRFLCPLFRLGLGIIVSKGRVITGSAVLRTVSQSAQLRPRPARSQGPAPTVLRQPLATQWIQL